MRILITNDDGIHASQLMPLARWARKLGEVTVIAPNREKSGASQSIQLHQSFAVERQDWDEGIAAYAIGSSPADCVRFAVLGMKQRYDLVISGINRGFNIGADAMYSGTVAAVIEAAVLGLPAIALSTCPEYYDQAANHLDRVFDFIRQNKLMDKHSIYNINIPPQPKSIRFTHQGGPYYSDDFAPEPNDMYRPMGKAVFTPAAHSEFDTDCVLHDRCISLSPLTVDRTDWKAYDALKD